jgi:hypothetical protein
MTGQGRAPYPSSFHYDAASQESGGMDAALLRQARCLTLRNNNRRIALLWGRRGLMIEHEQ